MNIASTNMERIQNISLGKNREAPSECNKGAEAKDGSG
jgi:hypothetical protein